MYFCAATYHITSMHYPAIALVTGCYNDEKYIGETIESVLSQNYPNLQYVVINDGSTDGSLRVIQKYEKFLHYFENWEGYRKSIAAALNRGFSHTDASLMGWINSDDVLLPKSLLTVADIFEEMPGVDWFTGLATTLNDRSQIVEVRPFRKNLYDYLAGDWQTIQQESTFWRRSLWDQAGGHLEESFEHAFDVELWTRFFRFAEHYHVTTVLGGYRRISESGSIRHKDEFYAFVKHALDELRRQIPATDMKRTRHYSALKRYARRFLRFIPHAWYEKSKRLAPLGYKIISRDYANNRYALRTQNPFRSLFE